MITMRELENINLKRQTSFVYSIFIYASSFFDLRGHCGPDRTVHVVGFTK